MSWLALVGIIIEALKYLPDLIEAIRKWREIFHRVQSPKAQWIERGRFGAELEKAMARKAQGLVADGPCNVVDFVCKFAERYPAK